MQTRKKATEDMEHTEERAPGPGDPMKKKCEGYLSNSSMLTKRHRFYDQIKGRILHVTSTAGLEGILNDGCIRANLHNSLDQTYYVCQHLQAVSVLDLKNAIEKRLFDKYANWTCVFSFHHPSVVLCLRAENVEPNLKHRCDIPNVMSLPGPFISEAEACYSGEIPVSAIQEAMVLTMPRYNVCFKSSYLRSVLDFAKHVPPRRRRRQAGLFLAEDLSQLDSG